MRLFREYTFSWQQIAMFKMYLFTGGLLIGSYFNTVIMTYFLELSLVFMLLLLYFCYQLLAGKL